MIISDKLRLGVSDGRSYSGIIDKILNQHKDKFSKRISSDEIGLFTMLQFGRVDIIIEFPISATYTTRKIGMSDEIMLLPILGMEPFTEAYIAGPGDKWGAKVMTAIDRAMQDPETITKFSHYYSNWLPNKSSVLAYHTIVEDYYRAHHGIEVDL